MLTKKQYQLLIFIDQRMKETGIAPSFDEMKEALDLKSKSGIHRLITGLEERGFIRRLIHRARALEVMRLPENHAESPTNAPRGSRLRFTPNVIHADFSSPLVGQKSEIVADTAQVPLYGKIAAGTPIEALRDQSTTIGVPGDMIGQGGHYALTIEGDSMIDAGILDGDLAVIRQCDTAENGQIIVALIDNYEATLKRFRRRGASIALEPANPRHETRIFGPDRVKVQGRLVGIIRRY